MKNRFSRQGRPISCRHFDLPIFLMEGEGTGGGGTTNPSVPASNKPSAADVLEQYGGNAVRMAERLTTLMNENFDYREKARNHERDMSDLKAKLPADGQIVISKADAELLEKYKKFGAVDVLETELKTGREAVGIVAKDRQAKTTEKAAKAEGLKSGALKLLVNARNLPVSVRDVDAQDKDGNAIKVERGFVTVKNGDQDEEQPLLTYLKANLDEDEYQALLDDGSTNSSGNSNNGNGSGSGFQYPPQSGGNRGNNQQQGQGSYASRSYANHNAPQSKK